MLVTLVVLLDLHLADHLVLVFDLLLDLLNVLGHLTEVLLLKEVAISVNWQLWGSQDILNGVGNDVVLVRDETHDGLLVLFGDGCSLDFLGVTKFLECSALLKHWVTSSLLSEASGLWHGCTLGSTEGQAGSILSVGPTKRIILT